jgi:hypothetical protein
MKTIISAAFFVAFAAITAYTVTGPAMAGWTCQQRGNFTNCYNNQTGEQYSCYSGYGGTTTCN